MYNHTYQCFWLLIVSVVWSAKMGNFYFHLDPCIAEFGRCRCRIFTSAENQLKKNSTKPNGAHRSRRKSILALSFISSYSTTYTLIHTKIMPHDKTTSIFTQSFWILVETTVLRSSHGTLIFAHHYHTRLCIFKRLCIFGPKGAIQIHYYYYYYYYTILCLKNAQL